MDIDNLYISNIHGAAGKLIRCRLQNLTDENPNILNTLERRWTLLLLQYHIYTSNQFEQYIPCLLACNW